MDPEIKALIEIMLRSHNQLAEALIENTKLMHELGMAVADLTKTVERFIQIGD